MRTVTFFISLILGLTYLNAQTVNSLQAQNILKDHFISLTEAQVIYPNLPGELAIPFSSQTLKNNPDSWLLPIKVQDQFKYLLVRANFEFEVCMLKRVDTLGLRTSKEVLSMLKILRPTFPERANSNEAFKYFFRTKDDAGTREKNIYKKAVAYDGRNFLVINWPNKTELGVVQQKCIFYITKNIKGMEIVLGQESLPDYGLAIKDDQSIFVLTLLSHQTK